MPGAASLSPSFLVTLGVFVSGCLSNLSYGVIGPPGQHDDEYTWEIQLHPYWLALELLVEDYLGV